MTQIKSSEKLIREVSSNLAESRRPLQPQKRKFSYLSLSGPKGQYVRRREQYSCGLHHCPLPSHTESSKLHIRKSFYFQKFYLLLVFLYRTKGDLKYDIMTNVIDIPFLFASIWIRIDGHHSIKFHSNIDTLTYIISAQGPLMRCIKCHHMIDCSGLSFWTNAWLRLWYHSHTLR